MNLPKRILALILCLAMTLSMLPLTAFAASEPRQTEAEPTETVPLQTEALEEEDGFVFVEPGRENDDPVGDIIITDKAYRVQRNPDLKSWTILEYLGSSADVVIPAEYDGLPITRIRAYAFRSKTALRTVQIPETVTRMEEGVFDGCNGLTYNIYEGGKYLPSANNPYYYYCGPVDSTVTEGTMHQDTKIVAAFAFRGCKDLRSVVVPDGVKQVGYGMVLGCELESLTLPFVGELGTDRNPQFGWAFGARSFGGNISYVPMRLKTVVITGGTDGKQGTIAQGAFYGVDMIEDITLPFLGGSATSTANAFITYYWGASSYSENILPASVISVTIESGELGNGALYGCANLKSIVIPANITSISKYTFYNCSSLESITIPAGVTSIGVSAFYGCKKLKSIILPDSLTAIDQSAFYICRSLTSISIPDNVTVIGGSAFYGCDSLQSVIIPDGITSIYSNTFYGCDTLKSIVIPNGITSIGTFAFADCFDLTSITISKGVTTIDSNAFINCVNLKSVRINDLKAWCEIRFGNENANPLTNAKNLYLNGELLTDAVIPTGITAIGNYAFSGCESITNITIPDSITSIGKGAFNGCTNLKGIYISDLAVWYNIKFGNEYANPLFYAKKLYLNGAMVTDLVIPEGMTSVNDYAFYGCRLKSITIPKSVTSIGRGAFSNCNLYKVINNSALELKFSIGYSSGVTDSVKVLVNPDGSVSNRGEGLGPEYHAYFETAEGFLVETYNGEYELIAYLGSADTVTLPLNINGNTYTVNGMEGVRNIIIPEGVTSIDSTMFMNCSDLESVVIPDSVTSIGYAAFAGCIKLKNITIPASVTSIGDNAFGNCSSLESIIIPASVTSIGSFAFSGCSSLKNITIPNSVTSIYGMFKECSSLESITIPDAVTSIDPSAFKDCSSLKSIIIPAGVKSIRSYAFYGCSSLASITLPDSITSIDDYAFYGCSGLESITIPNSITSLGEYAFSMCKSLKSITIPGGVKYVKSSAFLNCINLESVTIQPGVHSIGEHAFGNCISLESVTIPSTVLYVYSYAFDGCSGLKNVYISDLATWCKTTFYSVSSNPLSFAENFYVNGVLTREVMIPDGIVAASYTFYAPYAVDRLHLNENAKGFVAESISNEITIEVDEKNPYVQIIDGVLYNKPATKILAVTAKAVTVTIPEGVTAINDSAFLGCGNLKSVTIPNSVTSIGYHAFSRCQNLENITIPGNVASIRGSAFANCSKLTNVTIASGVTSIGDSAFSGCSSLKSVAIPDSVTSLGNSAFYGCSSLESITISNNLASIGSATFRECSSLESITITNSVTSIGNSAFSGCIKLQGITIPDGVTSIGTYAFNGCISLTNITIPDSVTSIGEYAFYDCSSLESVIIPGSVMAIKGYTFRNCDNLKELVIQEGTITIGQYAFDSCNSLQNITIPKGVTTIGTFAFSSCSNLESITISEGVTTIGNYAFWGCRSLSDITIPKSVTVIGDGAFISCYNINNVYIDDLAAWCTIQFAADLANPLYYANNLYLNGVAVTDLVIPAGVTNIGAYAFCNHTHLESVTVPESVTSIGAYAFRNCKKLINITIAQGVNTIGNYAFENCSSLCSITIPKSVDSIGSYAFQNCNGLYKVINYSTANLTIGSTGYGYVARYAKILENSDGSVSNLGFGYIETAEGFLFETHNGAYKLIAYLGSADTVTLPLDINGNTYSVYKMKGVRNVIIPDGVTAIDSNAFEDCSSLESITIPESVTSVGRYAFRNCISLKTITIPESVTTIAVSAFENCSSLESITILDGVASIEWYAFRDCISLKSIIIPESVTRVGGYAFSNCRELESVRVCGKVTIEDYAFTGCTSLGIVELRDVQNIGSYAFPGCSNLQYNGEKNEWRHVLKASDWDAGMPEYTVEFAEDTGILYETNTDRTEFYVAGVSKQFTEVAPPATYSGRAVTAVLSNAFGGSATLETVTLPDTVIYIGENAFANCTGLKNIKFPTGLQQMARGILAGCNALEELNLPFLGKRATDTQDAYLSYIFGGYSCKDNAAYVPKGLKTVTLNSGNQLADHAFENCAHLRVVNLPATVTALGDYAFSGCAELKAVALPDGLTAIGDYTFSGCTAMDEIVLPEALGTIGDYAFRRCESLKSFTLPDSVTVVGVMILDGCNSLTQIHIGAGLGYDGIADTHNQANGNPIFGLDKSASQLNTYTVAAKNPDFAVQDNILYRKMDIDGQPVAVEIVDAPAKANLSNYTMPESIVKIGAHAFAYNNTLRTIELKYVRMVGNNAFYKAENLIVAEFVVPSESGIQSPEVDKICYNQFVGKEAFAGCTSLQRVNLDSESLLGVAEDAFADCSSLATVNLGRNIQSIGIGAFGSSGSSTPALSAINVHTENLNYHSIDGILYQENADGTLMLLVYPALSTAYTKQDGKNVFYVPSEKVTGVESYAFRMAQNLDEIYLMPQQEMRVGDYAFANTMLEKVYVGENVASLGLKRGEGEYTVFADCNYLVNIEVDASNKYYSSQDGILFDKNATRLIKYPTAKTGSLYAVPDTVRAIASMAFKNNNDLQRVHIRSQVDTVGLEAFYGCSALSLIFFDEVYAPASVLENAFTTYDSLNEGHLYDPKTQLGYSQGYYTDGNGQYGWSNYEDVYNLTLCQALPEYKGRTGNDFYAIVIVDSNGNRVKDTHLDDKGNPVSNLRVTLTDPNGVSETVSTGLNGASSGVAMFYDLFENASMGFSLVFDGAYSLKITDSEGKYFVYNNPSFYLDEDMRITYVTVAELPSVYGTTCGETDINTQTAEINKAEYGYINVELIDASKGYAEGNLKTAEEHEYVDVSAIAYCDTKAGWSFVDAQGNVLDAEADGLYQNGIKVCDVTSAQVQDGSTLFTFHMDVAKFVPEVPVEARLSAFNRVGAVFVCSTVLNIHVFDFIVTEDDVNLETEEIEVDLAKENALLAKLFGGDGFDVKLGKNVGFNIAVDGSRVEMTLTGKGEKDLKKYSSYEAGYEANKEPHNKNTYFFQFKDVYKDKKGEKHLLTYNVRFARGTEDSNYFYYRCYIYEDEYNNEVAKFYGAVNGLSDTVAKAVGAKTLRQRVAPKALMIYKTHNFVSNQKAKTIKDFGKLDSSAVYIEAVTSTPNYTNNRSLEVELSGKLVFEYDKKNGLKPVSSEIHGELYYSFKHNAQFVVWVIPVVLEVEVKLGGEVDIKLKIDKDRGMSLEEAELTLAMDISAKVGVGCRVASVGVYGSVGAVFVLEFYPDCGLDRLNVNGEIGAYLKIMWYTKKFSIAKFDYKASRADAQPLMYAARPSAAMYLAENYSSEDMDDCEGSAHIVFVGERVYKISYVNAQSRAGYDAYNYRKLAVAQWSGNDWDTPVIIDDNFRNDASYDLYSVGDKLYVVFTQQADALTQETVDDTYASSANMVIKVAEITDLSAMSVTSVCEGPYYKYLPTLTQVEDSLAVVWAENTDNNMFGVSPYNYIDTNGESHIFETGANTVYISSLVNGQWLMPEPVQTGLSAVTDLAVAENGSICYVVDQNGDLGDSEDRVLYTVDRERKAATAVNQVTDGSVTGVDADGSGFVYYLEGAGENPSGLRSLGTTEEMAGLLSGITELGDNYKILRDGQGNICAVFYTSLKVWQEGEDTVDGSALYAIFCNDGKWGKPVEMDAFPAESDVYIASFDVLYNSGSSVMITAEYANQNGTFLYQLTDSDVRLKSKLTVVDYQVDYVKQTLAITVRNDGAKTAEVFISYGDGERTSCQQWVTSGDTQTVEIPLDCDEDLTPVIKVYDSPDGDAMHTISDLDLNYSDIVPMVKQLLLGKDNNLLIGVKNTGVLEDSGYLVVRPGNFNSETVCAPDLIAAAKQSKGRELTAGEVVAVSDKKLGQFWVIRVDVASGAVQHYEISLADVALDGENALFSICAYVNSGKEKGSAKENNAVYASYKQMSGVLAEGETAAVVPKLQTEFAEFDGKTQSHLQIGFSCGANDMVQSVTVNGNTLAADAYTVSLNSGVGTLTIRKTALEQLAPGEYQVNVSFASNESGNLQLSVPAYHIITWVADGQELCTTEVKHGAMPYLATKPTKDGYVFDGWKTEAAGEQIGLHAAEEDTTYYALWRAAKERYQVTWAFTNQNGETVSVVEEYSYNALPDFRGKIITPAEKTFSHWDKEITAVTEDVTYTAVYKKLVFGSATIENTKITTACGQTFTTMLKLSNVENMRETQIDITFDRTVAELLDVVPNDNVQLLEQGENHLILVVSFEVGQTTKDLAELTFKAKENLPAGKRNILYAESQDTYEAKWQDMVIHAEEVIPAIDATCTEDGLTAGVKCAACGEILVPQEKIPATGHTHTELPAVSATCTEPGWTAGVKCSSCDTVLTAQSQIPATGIHRERIIPAQESTCTAMGHTQGSYCFDCGKMLVIPLATPTTGHTEEIIPAKPATCIETGLSEGKKCSVCDRILVEQEVINTVDHEWLYIEAEEPTCIETGLTEGEKCANCGEVSIEQEEIEALGHTAGEVVKENETDTGYDMVIYCETCSAELSRETIDTACTHSYDHDFDADCNDCGEVRELNNTFKFENYRVVFSDSNTTHKNVRVEIYELGNQTVADPTDEKALKAIDTSPVTHWGAGNINKILITDAGNYVLLLKYNVGTGSAIKVPLQISISADPKLIIDKNNKLTVIDNDGANINHRVVVYYLGDQTVDDIYDEAALKAIDGAPETHWQKTRINKLALIKGGNYVMHLCYNVGTGAKQTVAQTFTVESIPTLSVDINNKVVVTEENAENKNHRAVVYFLGDTVIEDPYDEAAVKAAAVTTSKTYWGLKEINGIELKEGGNYVIHLYYNVGTSEKRTLALDVTLNERPVLSVSADNKLVVTYTDPEINNVRAYIYNVGEANVSDIYDEAALKKIATPTQVWGLSSILKKQLTPGTYVVHLYYSVGTSAKKTVALKVTI